MRAAKTAAERIRLMRERREALGLTRLELYAHPDDHQAIKDTAARLQRRRERAAAAADAKKPAR
jgi:hypothetical protein